MKNKIIVAYLVFLFTNCVCAGLLAESQSIATAVTATAEGDNVFTMAIGPGVTFSFLNKDWTGIEIPVSFSYDYTEQNSDGNNHNRNYSYSIGVGYILPLKKIVNLHLNLVPGIGIKYDYKYSKTVYPLGRSYTLMATANLKLEIEYFFGTLFSFIPDGVSVGGSYTISADESYTESFNLGQYSHLWSFRGSLGATASTLYGLMIKYYF